MVMEVMEIAYGGQFVHVEWDKIFTPLLEIWEEEDEEDSPETCRVFEEILKS